MSRKEPLSPDGTLGSAEVSATGTPPADGIAFDRRGNLLVLGQDTLWLVDHATPTTTVLSADPLFEWPVEPRLRPGPGIRQEGTSSSPTSGPR